ncbi:ciliary microtubule inner protein 4-like [Scyliorhinus torazame]
MSDGGQRYPGRTLFGTTLDSKGYFQGLSEEEQASAVPGEAQANRQPVPRLEKRQGSFCKTESDRAPMRGREGGSSLDASRIMSPKSGSAKAARGTRYHDKDCKSELKESCTTVPPSCDGRISEMQFDGDRSPVASTPRSTTDGVQSPRETLKQRPNQKEECVIPQNIKHKFGSQLMDELLTDDEVNKFMKQKEMSSKRSDSLTQPQEKPSDHINWYERIGYPLRCNIFPGDSGEWKSEAQSTYTKEVHHRFKHDPEHWHGRTTDQLGHWVEMSIVHRKMKKALEQLEKQSENS